MVKSWIHHCIVHRISPSSDSGQLYLQITSKNIYCLKFKTQTYPKPGINHLFNMLNLVNILEKLLKTILWPEKDGKKVDHGCHRSQYLYELLSPIVQNMI